jgi:hypothetical protein
MLLVIILIELFLLYLISKRVKSLTFQTAYRITHNQHLSLVVFSLLFYPGIVVHELAHLVTAAVLFVPVKSMHLTPFFTEEGKIQGGSVITKDVDIVRKSLIGIAPLVVGLIILWLVTYFLLLPVFFVYFPNFQFLISNFQTITNNQFLNSNNVAIQQFSTTVYQLPFTVFFLYLIFSISSSMFSSRQDTKPLKFVIPLIIIIGIFAYLLGFKIEWIQEAISYFSTILSLCLLSLLIALLLQIFSLCILYIFK